MAYGPDAVHELIVESGRSYPVSARRLTESMPMENVTIDEAGNSMLLSELLAAAEAERFESRAHLERELGPVCAAESEARRSGLVDRIRRVFLGP